MATNLGKRFTYFEEEKWEGGQALVYKGVDLFDRGRDVAVKFLKVKISDAHTALAFDRECSALYKLSHPGIVKLIEGGHDPDTNKRYIVTEWLPETLVGWLAKEGSTNWDDFYATYGTRILAALKYAHSKKVTHRDVSPDNILVDGQGAPKLIDFGIARLFEFPQLGHTMASFKKKPYCPEDEITSDDGSGRDAWGYVASCVALLSKKHLETYTDLREALEKLSLPQDIENIFVKALASNPQERYESVLDLAADLATIQYKHSASAIKRLVVPIVFSTAVLVRLNDYFPSASHSDLKSRYLSTLNAEGYARKQPTEKDNGGNNPKDIELLAGDAVFLCSVDKMTGNCLFIKGVRLLDGYWADQFRQGCWRPRATFRISEHDDSTGPTQIREFVIGLEEYERRFAAQQATRKNEEFFETWKNILRLKEEIERGEYAEIAFSRGELEGRRFHIQAVDDWPDELLGTRRAFEISDGKIQRGEVDEINGTLLTLYLDEDIDAPPRNGVLKIDDIAAKMAIQRQENALDAIRYDRSVSTRIRQVIVDPEKVTNIQESTINGFMLQDFDEDKQHATRKALADNPVVLVQGPPGTGKTQLIVEIVSQYIARNPSGRILLTSQTHIALDNALERVLEVLPSIKAVRVGRAQDNRIARNVRSLTLAEVAERWRKEFATKTNKFLEDFASQWNISLEDLRLSRAIAAYHAALQAVERQDDYMENMSKTIESLESDLNIEHSNEPGGTALEKREALEALTEDYSQGQRHARRLKKDVRYKKTELEKMGTEGKKFGELPADVLKVWESMLGGHTDKQHQTAHLIDLAQEWQMRFSQSKELYPVVLADSQIVAGTCVGFIGAPGILDLEFDVCIVDEASKATASEICVPLARSNRAVLIGDHKQLPPFIDPETCKPDRLGKYSLKISDLHENLFERLHKELPEKATVLLSRQYRMVPEIGNLISECFYEKKLESEQRAVRFDLSLVGVDKPVTWFDTSQINSRFEHRDGDSYKNIFEAQQIGKLLSRINWCLGLSNGRDVHTVAVLTGYRPQKSELNRQIDRVQGNIDRLEIECGTVHSFQGRQADISIFSVTRANTSGSVGFLKEFSLLNVALSRGKDYQIIVGDFGFAKSQGDESPIGQVAAYVQNNPTACSIKVVEI